MEEKPRHAASRKRPVWLIPAVAIAVSVAVTACICVTLFPRSSEETSEQNDSAVAESSVPTEGQPTEFVVTEPVISTTAKKTEKTKTTTAVPRVKVTSAKKDTGEEDPMNPNAIKKTTETTAKKGKITAAKTSITAALSSGVTLSMLTKDFGASGNIIGIDVYRATGNSPAGDSKIDWGKVKNAGVRFAMIRCGYRGTASGSIFEDANFRQNMQRALAVGLPVGVYFYSAAITVEEAKQEAQTVLDLIKDYDVTWPIAFDYECFEDRVAEAKPALTSSDFTDMAIAFMEYIIQQGKIQHNKDYTPMLYGGRSKLKSSFNLTQLKAYRIWYPQYTKDITFKWTDIPHAIWQCASDGRVAGIVGNVDLDIAYEDFSKPHTPRLTDEPLTTAPFTTTASVSSAEAVSSTKLSEEEEKATAPIKNSTVSTVAHS